MHPVNGRRIPIIADAELVDMAFGTGACHRAFLPRRLRHAMLLQLSLLLSSACSLFCF